ncbi:MAG TPA: hypothetical protein VII31_03835 [Caldimonas sp.]|jgi:hypothetical protein
MSDPAPPKMQFEVVTTRRSAHASESRCKQARITLDTDRAANPHAELLLGAAQ